MQDETLYGWRGADGSLPGHRGEPMWIPVGGWGVCSGCPERGAGAYRRGLFAYLFLCEQMVDFGVEGRKEKVPPGGFG